jgi:hypothetical protein
MAAMEALDAERAPRFAAVADLTVDTAGVAPDDVVLTILDALPPDLQLIGRPPRRAVPDGVRSRGRSPGS